MNRVLELTLLQEDIQSEINLLEQTYAKSKDFSTKKHALERIGELSTMSLEITKQIFAENHKYLKQLINQ